MNTDVTNDFQLARYSGAMLTASLRTGSSRLSDAIRTVQSQGWSGPHETIHADAGGMPERVD